MAAFESPVPAMRAVFKSLHRPLTVCGVDRRLFFLSLLVGVAAFNLFFSFLAGCLLFVLLYACARWSTVHDPQLLHVLLRASQARSRYDAAKHAPFAFERRSPSWSK